MAGTLERINQDIAALEQDVLRLGDELQETYTSYLKALGMAVRQQLILACYHICTQNYPRQFLQLSFNQRQQFQDVLKSLAKQTQAELTGLVLSEARLPYGSVSEQTPAESSLQEANFSDPPPETLLRQCDRLERAILETLQTTSHAANRLLQQADILPKHLPDLLLEAAAKAEASEGIVAPPNLLNLLVEAVGDKGTEEAKAAEAQQLTAVMQLMAVHLRLGEIEFADSSAMSWRNKLRSLSGRLKALILEFQKKLREKAIAEAELAWRASWTND